MKIVRLASFFALLLLGFAAAAATGARAADQSASGNYQFTLEDGLAKSLLFEAHAQGGGAATGEMFFTDEAVITILEDGSDDEGKTYDGYYVKAEFDGMVVKDNKAVMCGIVRDSNINAMLGKRVMLTVEDNGDNGEKPDRVTWGVYEPTDKSWTPSDAEWEKDPGVGLTWWATDAEEKDDVGYKMPKDETISTQSFPVPAYDFPEVARSEGDIKVQP